jgi:hypothetical protein
MRLRWTLGALLLLGGWASIRAADNVKVIPVERFGASPAWQAPQKVQADAQGRVYLLRTDTLEVFPVGKAGALGNPTKLEAATPLNAPVLDAAMGPGGPGDWLLRLPLEVRWFVAGQEKSLPPLSWRPWGVGYLRTTPVVSVVPLPAPVNGIVVRHPGDEGPSRAPAVLELSGDRWSELVTEPWPAQRDANTLTESLARLLLGDRSGKLWAAHLYGYVLERYNSAGRSLSKLQVDQGRVEHVQANDVSVSAEVRPDDRPHFQPFLGVSKLTALAEGPDHRIYLLVQPGKGEDSLHLDRYDPAQDTLERVTLGVQLTGRASLAAGREGLYLVGHGGDQGRWHVSWDRLDAADWKAVPVDGAPRPANALHPNPAHPRPKSPSAGARKGPANAEGSGRG